MREAGNSLFLVKFSCKLLLALIVALALVNRATDARAQAELKFTASDASIGDQFGRSVAISGDTAVVGAPGNDDDGLGSGSVYVYQQDFFGNWIEVTSITASDAAANDQFGISVAIEGDTVLVGAHYDDDAGDLSGSAYVYQRDEGGAGNWGEVAKLTALDASAGGYFGGSVAVSGNTALVGAIGDANAGAWSGSAYVYQRDEGGVNNWGQLTKLVALDAAASAYFGYSVAISSDTAVVGADGDDLSGSAYVYQRDEGGLNNWGQLAKLTASDAIAGGHFGWSVAASADTVIVGAFGAADAGASSGSAYLYQQDLGGAGNWGELAKLTASDANAGDLFGQSVAISGNTVVVGAYGNDDAGGFSGSAYVHHLNAGGAGNWGQLFKLTASDAATYDYFGRSVAISDGQVIVGAHDDDDAGNNSGSAYLYSELLVCGDGVLQPNAGEDCDDGNTVNLDGCSAICSTNETCGDGLIDPGEVCDHGGESASCDADCTAAFCGDQTVNLTAGEQCDDGNILPGDGCDNCMWVPPTTTVTVSPTTTLNTTTTTTTTTLPACSGSLGIDQCKLKAKFRKIETKPDKLVVSCKVLDASAAVDGIDPSVEQMLFSMDDAGGVCFTTTTDPADCVEKKGSFKCKPPRGTVPYVQVKIKPDRRNPGSYKLKYKAKDADIQCLDLAETPWTMGLEVGDDCGQAACPSTGRRIECFSMPDLFIHSDDISFVSKNGDTTPFAQAEVGDTIVLGGQLHNSASGGTATDITGTVYIELGYDRIELGTFQVNTMVSGETRTIDIIPNPLLPVPAVNLGNGQFSWIVTQPSLWLHDFCYEITGSVLTDSSPVDNTACRSLTVGGP
ncbi:MAG TPA: DUF4215 domain-containing protein [Deltaproteobacteria bacterium]|nr:DUF4215 domain-containing protein [Candidatus Binatota bacterium]HIL14455.1 DUF4215 domain-containing protein [Deltaproteobacteria bacterium]